MNTVRFLFVGVLLLGLTACGAGKTLVLDPSHDATFRASSIRIEAESPNVDVPSEAQETFRQELSDKLYKKGGFVQGDALSLRYRFIEYDAGNRFKRWLVGGIGNAGEASIAVRVAFVRNGEELSHIQVEGKIGSGMFGGGASNAVKKAADQAASYALRHYR